MCVYLYVHIGHVSGPEAFWFEAEGLLIRGGLRPRFECLEVEAFQHTGVSQTLHLSKLLPFLEGFVIPAPSFNGKWEASWSRIKDVGNPLPYV